MLAVRLDLLPATRAADIAYLWLQANRAGDSEMAQGDARILKVIDERMSDPTAWFIGAFNGNALVGIAHGLAARTDDDGAGEESIASLLHLSMIAVEPSHWGSGIGRRLLERALDITRERGYSHVQLWTATDNRRAIGLYVCAGFIASGRTKSDDRGKQLAHFERELPL